MEIQDEISLEGLLDNDESKSKWTAKDSVFTKLFGAEDKKYLYQLYRALHPEDEATAKEDLTVMTLESHLLEQQHNDLGFLVGTRLIILVEAQSTWSENIVYRVLLYVAMTWYKYVKRVNANIYGEKKISLPEPELYVIYTGEEDHPEALSLSDTFFGGKDIGVDCKVKIITDGKKGDIINQYVRFCHVLDEQIKIHGRTRKAVEETIRICQGEDVLNEYLERQKEEVMDVMMTLFNEETIVRDYGNSKMAEGRTEGQNSMIESMLRKGKTPEEIVDLCDVSMQQVKEVERNMLSLA